MKYALLTVEDVSLDGIVTPSETVVPPAVWNANSANDVSTNKPAMAKADSFPFIMFITLAQ
jgi:hypothetical protein